MYLLELFCNGCYLFRLDSIESHYTKEINELIYIFIQYHSSLVNTIFTLFDLKKNYSQKGISEAKGF